MKAGSFPSRLALKSHSIFPNISILLVNRSTAKLNRADIQAAIDEARRQKSPSQNGMAIIAETFQNTSRPCTTLSRLNAKKTPATTTIPATKQPRIVSCLSFTRRATVRNVGQNGAGHANKKKVKTQLERSN